MKNRNYKKMLEKIDSFVNNDWGFDIDCHSLPNSKPFTQKEAREMAAILMRIYQISHCLTCEACDPILTNPLLMY